MRAQLCRPPNCQGEELVLGGLPPLTSIRFSIAQGRIGKEGEPFPETKRFWEGLMCSNQRRKQKPLHIFLECSLTQNSLVFMRKSTGVCVPLD